MSNGIFLSRGMSIRFRNISLTIGEGGDSFGNIDVDLRFDACTAWARIALEHRLSAIAAREARILAWSGSDENEKGSTLEEEFRASLQAVVAAASAIDALYAMVCYYFPIDSAIRKAWRDNRTSRPTQIRETLRLTFGFGPKSNQLAKQYLDALYKVRDAALHPSANHQPPRFHPEINVSTEWRFWTFRADVADTLICVMSQILWDIARFPCKDSVRESDFMKHYRKSIEELFPNGFPTPREAQVTFGLPQPM